MLRSMITLVKDFPARLCLQRVVPRFPLGMVMLILGVAIGRLITPETPEVSAIPAIKQLESSPKNLEDALPQRKGEFANSRELELKEIRFVCRDDLLRP